MQLSFCFCCEINKQIEIEMIKKRTENAIDKVPVPTIIQQPKRGELIQLRKLSTFKKRKKIEDQENRKESTFITYLTTPVNHIPQVNSPLRQMFENSIPTVSATSNFNYKSRNGKEYKMTFNQTKPGVYEGTYKGKNFAVVKGEFCSKDGAFSTLDEKLILKNYLQFVAAMQQGIIGLEETLLNSLNQQLPVPNLRYLSELTIPNTSKINVNYTADNGEKFKMTFKQIKPGLFRGTINGKIFSIVNGQVLKLRPEPDYDLNKDLILNTFYRAMLGLRQTNLGIQPGEWAIETKLSGNQLNPMELLKAACPERRLLFEADCLKVHNEFRNIHDVPPLTHSGVLCGMAREWAEHLALKGTSYRRPNNEYGENLYFTQDMILDARAVVSTWYNEIDLYDYSKPHFSKETEHFTQIIWKDTKEMGTGIAQLGDKVWVCCYYYPSGNVMSKYCEGQVTSPGPVNRS